MLKEAIEKIEELAKPIILDKDGCTYAVNKDGEAQEIIPEAVYQSCLSLNSLDALVQMVRTEGVSVDRCADKLYLSVKDHMTVACFGHPQKDLREERINYYEAQAKDVPGWDGEVKMAFDKAAVALQTRFQDGGDRDYTLTLLSQITCGAKVTYNDIGDDSGHTEGRFAPAEQHHPPAGEAAALPHLPGGGAAGGPVPDPH